MCASAFSANVNSLTGPDTDKSYLSRGVQYQLNVHSCETQWECVRLLLLPTRCENSITVYTQQHQVHHTESFPSVLCDADRKAELSTSTQASPHSHWSPRENPLSVLTLQDYIISDSRTHITSSFKALHPCLWLSVGTAFQSRDAGRLPYEISTGLGRFALDTTTVVSNQTHE